MRDFFNFEIISTGSICREKASKDLSIKKIIQSGALVDDETITRWLKEAVQNTKDNKSIILNGFPRDIQQADKLGEIFHDTNRELTLAVYLEVPDEELKRRLLSRVYCKVCDEKILIGREECLKCGGKIIKREDDNEAAIEKRISLFYDQTMPLIRYFESKNKLLTINADQPVEDIHRELKEKLEVI